MMKLEELVEWKWSRNRMESNPQNGIRIEAGILNGSGSVMELEYLEWN